MASLLKGFPLSKAFRKQSISSSSSCRHKKLSEDWTTVREPVKEGVPFYVKYLGSSWVQKASGEEATAEAIKTIIALAKNKKLSPIKLTISLRGISMTEISSDEILLEISIYRISYCSADATYDRVFAFIATNQNETLECHAFLCPKKKMAQSATLTIAQAFNLAFELWQKNQERKSRLSYSPGSNCRKCCHLVSSRNSSTSRIKNETLEKNNETSNSCFKEEKKTKTIAKSDESEDNLLIDLSISPKESNNEVRTISFVDLESDGSQKEKGHWVVFDSGENDKMNHSFSELCNKPRDSHPLIQNLPRNAKEYSLEAFAWTSQENSSVKIESLASPLQMNQLFSPIGSPLKLSSATNSRRTTTIPSQLQKESIHDKSWNYLSDCHSLDLLA